MSLETEIKNLTAAVNRLTDAMEVQSGSRPLPAANAGVEFAEKAAAHAAEVTKAATPIREVTEEATKPLALEDIKKAMMAMSAKFDIAAGTAKSKAILSRFGAQKLSQVPAEAYVEFVALCESVGAGGEV